jgi:MYXO-CTERM domain-containing protein
VRWREGTTSANHPDLEAPHVAARRSDEEDSHMSRNDAKAMIRTGVLALCLTATPVMLTSAQTGSAGSTGTTGTTGTSTTGTATTGTTGTAATNGTMGTPGGAVGTGTAATGGATGTGAIGTGDTTAGAGTAAAGGGTQAGTYDQQSNGGGSSKIGLLGLLGLIGLAGLRRHEHVDTTTTRYDTPEPVSRR